MNTLKQSDLNSQRGAATLLTALVLLIGITLVTLTTSKTVLVETQISADNYRTTQAVAAANAAMDYAVAYFLNGGLDHDTDGVVDVIAQQSYASGTQTTTATVVFNNAAGTRCIPVGGTPSMKWGLVTAVGLSDDGLATRTITQCIGTRNVLEGEGPQQSLVSGASVGVTGSAQIINRYNDLNVWSGQSVSIGSAAMETYIRPTDVEIHDLTTAQLIDTTRSPSIPNVQKVSSSGLGTGTDIYANDSRLNISEPAFFDLFFLESKARMAQMAGSQKLASGAGSGDLNGLKGIIYVDGNASFGGNNTIGSATEPTILIVNGDFQFNGGTINALIYVSGQITGAGNATTVGTMISHGGVNRGAGTMTLVYAPSGGSNSDNPMDGTTGVISGSWRDW
ncbi:MAG: hypothetical protein Q7T40_07260 [Methylobacter sp.]|nr:hypothetical protein [Methylobacter sp.]